MPVKYFNHLYIHIISRNIFHICFHHIICSGVLILQKSKLTWSPETGTLWKGYFVSLFSRQCPWSWKGNVLVTALDFNCCWLLNLYTYIICVLNVFFVFFFFFVFLRMKIKRIVVCSWFWISVHIVLQTAKLFVKQSCSVFSCQPDACNISGKNFLIAIHQRSEVFSCICL